MFRLGHATTARARHLVGPQSVPGPTEMVIYPKCKCGGTAEVVLAREAPVSLVA